MQEPRHPAAGATALRSGAGAGRARRPALPRRPARPLAGPDTRVGAGGELVEEQLPEAAANWGSRRARTVRAAASEAWRVAVDTGLVEVVDEESDKGTVTVRRGPGAAHLGVAARGRSRSGSGRWRPSSPTRACPTSTTRSTAWTRAPSRLLPTGLGPRGGGRLPRRCARQPVPADRQRGRPRRHPGAAARAGRVHGRTGRQGSPPTTSSSRSRADDAPRRPVPAARTHRARRLLARRRGAHGGHRRPRRGGATGDDTTSRATAWCG